MQIVRRLRARIHHQLAIAVQIRDRCVLLERQVRVAFVEEHVLEDVVGIGERLVDVAELHRHLLVDVAFDAVVMDPRFARRQRLVVVGDGRQPLVLHVDEVSGLGRGDLIARDDERDRIADEPNLVDARARARPASQAECHTESADPSRSESAGRQGARPPERYRSPRRGHGVRASAAAWRTPSAAGSRSSAYLVCPVAFARPSTRRRGIPMTLPNVLIVIPRRFRPVGPRRSRMMRPRPLDRVENLLIARAPADVAGEGFANLIARRLGVSLRATPRPSGASPTCNTHTATRRNRRTRPAADEGAARSQGLRRFESSGRGMRRRATRHESCGSPSTSTVQAPHSPSSQPCLVPVSCRSSRSSSSSVL